MIKKIGLDIHGVISSNPEFFSQLTKDLISAGWEVHILTGPTKKKALAEIKDFNISYTHFFSIEDYHLEKKTPILYDELGNPWLDSETWDKTKGQYCEENKISLHLDDTGRYKKYFKTDFALYQHGGNNDSIQLKGKHHP